MNSVSAATELWKRYTGQRYCPTDEEVRMDINDLLYDHPEFVRLNTFDRLIGHVRVMRAMIASHNQGLIEFIKNRSFEEKDRFIINKTPYFVGKTLLWRENS